LLNKRKSLEKTALRGLFYFVRNVRELSVFAIDAFQKRNFQFMPA